MKISLFLSLLAMALVTITMSALQDLQGQDVQNASLAQLRTKVNPKDGLTYVWIPPGKFMMGCSPGDTTCDDDEKPAHEVTIEKGFWIGQTLVTQAAYQKVTGENPSSFHSSDQLPVDKVNWGDAYDYCKDVGMRIPGETEWEYAARANNPAARYDQNLDAIAWYNDNSFGHPHPVAEKEPNAWGLYDMLGNMWEWTSDPYKREDPVYVALRGGSWITHDRAMRVSIRAFDDARDGRRFTSFRCVGD
jgi:formylglycine-generating enzyme required for sulfatase activity